MASDDGPPPTMDGADSLAHDLMTALAIIKGNAQLLRRRAARPGDPGGTRTPDAIGDLDGERLGTGLHRIDVGLEAAIAAGIALIQFAKSQEAPDAGRHAEHDQSREDG